jgi:hypothetical protein
LLDTQPGEYHFGLDLQATPELARLLDAGAGARSKPVGLFKTDLLVDRAHLIEFGREYAGELVRRGLMQNNGAEPPLDSELGFLTQASLASALELANVDNARAARFWGKANELSLERYVLGELEGQARQFELDSPTVGDRGRPSSVSQQRSPPTRTCPSSASRLFAPGA